MPTDITKENIPFGDVVFQWTVKEYNKYDRSRRWYILSALLGVILLATSIWTGNYLFSLIIILIAIIIFLHEIQEPIDVPFAILDTGIVVGKNYYKFSELNNFWLIYNPPDVKNLYFGINGTIKHRIQIPLLDYDPRPIRDYLNEYLEEDLSQEEEPLSDRLARLFQIH